MTKPCDRCDATLSFVKLDTGSTLPVNPTPDPTGNVAAHRVGARLVGYVISLEKPMRDGFTLYRPHFADCPKDQPRVTASERTPTLFD
jgi:hypothetical protein